MAKSLRAPSPVLEKKAEMKNNNSASPTVFPIKTLTWVVMLTLGLFIVPGWQIWQSYRDYQALLRRQSQLNNALNVISQNEQLTALYARLAIAFGETKWAEQYRLLETRWAEAFAEATRLAPPIFSGPEGAALEKANANQSKVEESAILLAQQKRRDDALAVLADPAYQEARREFSSALQAVQNQVRQFEQKEERWQKQRALLSVGILAVAVPVLLWIWLRLLGMARKHLEERTRIENSLREQEELTRTLLTSLPQRIFFKNNDLVFVGVNEAFAQDLGRKPEEIIGKTDLDFFPAELAEKYRADDRRVLASKQPVTLEERNVSQGMERVVEVIKAPVIDKNGECLGLIGMFTDITKRKEDERALKELARRLEESNKELQDFAYVASHDLQEPLRKVRAFGDRLKARFSEQLPEEAQDYINRMQNAAERMQALINALLAYSRVTTKASPFQKVDLNAIVREVMGDLEVKLESVKGKVEAENLPVLEADPTQMRQLLQNLIGNALKFHRPGVPPMVKLYSRPFTPETMAADQISASGAFRPEQGREYVQIVVEDNGIGFDNKYAERIFGVFQRLHGRDEYEGSGVGLAICRKIARRHHGEITAIGRPGEGAAFILTLPLTQPQNKTKE
jgi:PAS domain S-box-containing protein